MSATVEEITAAYERLRAQYAEDRFKEGEAGNTASHNLEELEQAYADVMAGFVKEEKGGAFADLADIDRMIKENNLQGAQDALDAQSQRNGEWHYLQSIVYYKRGWYADCKKQLSLALALEPHNMKYKAASDKLEQFLGNVRVESNLGPQQYSQPAYDNEENRALDACCTQACCCSWMLYCCSC